MGGSKTSNTNRESPCSLTSKSQKCQLFAQAAGLPEALEGAAGVRVEGAVVGPHRPRQVRRFQRVKPRQEDEHLRHRPSGWLSFVHVLYIKIS